MGWAKWNKAVTIVGRDKWIKEIELVDEIPKSASGKILRRVLRDKAKQGATGVVVRDEAGEKARL